MNKTFFYGGAVLALPMLLGATIVWKSIQVTQQAYDKIVVQAIADNATIRDTATKMILAYHPTIQTSFFANNVAMPKGVNLYEAYLENTDVSQYKMLMQVGTTQYTMTTSTVDFYYTGGKIKSYFLDSTTLPDTFVVKFLAYDLKGKFIAERDINTENR